MKLAVVQMAMSADPEDNVQRALAQVDEAARRGANVVLLPELFEGRYFPQHEREESMRLAHPLEGHPFLGRFGEQAKRLGVVLPVSFFERSGPTCYNSLAMFDADGTMAGVYRKSHIPDGPGYEEKFYFAPGDTGFRVWNTRFGAIGVGICWDQWFPETARCMTLLGADLLLFPTAIGTEPPEAACLDTREMWRRAMIGHAVCNCVHLAAANRVGVEGGCVFYGSSFISDCCGEFVAEADRTAETIIMADLDLPAASRLRDAMGFFRDRRPELYSSLLTLDGRTYRPGFPTGFPRR